MTAEYTALEARVSELENQVRHTGHDKIDAANYGISLVHSDTRAILAGLDEVRATQADVDGRLDRHGEMLEEILHRLPEPPA
jgi:hypothetical protein